MLHSQNTTSENTKPSNVLIFGGSGVIGRAIATTFGLKGWSVGIHYHHNHKSAVETTKAIQEAQGHVRLYQADVSNPVQIQTIIQKFVQEHTSLALLVWAVGTGPSALLAKTTPDIWEHTLQTNLSGAFHILKEAAPIFEQQKNGAVVLIGSLAGEHGMVGQVAYAASKAGLIGLMKTAAREWGNWNIRVNAIFPGWHVSPLSSDGYDSALIQQTHLLNRSPSLEHVATNVYQLASTQDMSGQVWNLDSRI